MGREREDYNAWGIAAGASEAVTALTKPTAATAMGLARVGRLGSLPLLRRSIDQGPDQRGAAN